jgi:hypothetical protein
MVVKKNQAVLRKKIACFFARPELFGAEVRVAQETTLGRGRVEVRRLTVSDSLPKNYTGFSDVSQRFCLERQVVVKKTGQVREETVFGMSSLPASQVGASALLALVRGHWTTQGTAVTMCGT